MNETTIKEGVMNKHAKADLLGGTAATAHVFPKGIVVNPKKEGERGEEGSRAPPTVPPKAPEPENALALYAVVEEWQKLGELHRKAVRVVAEGQREHERLTNALTAAKRRLAEVTATVEALQAEFDVHDAEFSAAEAVVSDPVYSSADGVVAKLRTLVNP